MCVFEQIFGDPCFGTDVFKFHKNLW
jgi:hypothetical protein